MSGAAGNVFDSAGLGIAQSDHAVETGNRNLQFVRSKADGKDRRRHARKIDNFCRVFRQINTSRAGYGRARNDNELAIRN